MLMYWFYVLAKYVLIFLSIFLAGLVIYLHAQSSSETRKLYMMVFSTLFALILLGLSAVFSGQAASIYIAAQLSKGTLVEACGLFVGMSNGVNTSRGGETKNGFAVFVVKGQLEHFKMQHSKVDQGVLDDLKMSEYVCITYAKPPLLYRKILVSVKKHPVKRLR